MKLYPNQLAKHLQSALAPIYLISGDELLLMQEARDQIIAKAHQQGFTGQQLHQVNKDFKWQSLYTATHSLSLFDNKSVIEMRWQSAKPLREGAEALLDYCQRPMSDKLLLIIAPKIDGTTQRAKWYKAVDEVGVTIPIWPIEAQQLPKWVADRLQQAELSTDESGIKIIIDATEGNLLASAQEIEKLRLLYGPGRLTNDQIASAISDNARFDVFQLVDIIHAGKGAQVLRILQRLQQEGCEPTLVLWALTRELRVLCNVHALIKQGEQSSNALKKNGIWDKKQPLVKQSLRRLSLSNLYTLLEQAGLVDASIKGLRDASVWDEISSLAINMTQGVTQ